MTSSQEAYQKGWRAYGQGLSCPYVKATALYRSWWAGYFACQKYRRDVKSGKVPSHV